MFHRMEIRKTILVLCLLILTSVCIFRQLSVPDASVQTYWHLTDKIAIRDVNNINSSKKDTYEIELIRKDCGQLCNTSRGGVKGLYFNYISVNTNCQALFNNCYIDNGHNLPKAPRTIPNNLFKEFTMNGIIPVKFEYYDQQYLGRDARESIWTISTITKMVEQARKGLLRGNYGIAETNELRSALSRAPGIVNGRVLVIGSENPWVEACLIEAGAREIVTLEYGKINSNHPKIKSIIPSEFRTMFLNKSLGEFDAVTTFSSIEHSGLGRYGDALNPWGDIIIIAKAWCVTKKGGSLTIGVPYDYDHDKIVFNAHRIYGKKRYPYLTSNWRQIYRGKGSQRVHVFTK